MIISNLLFVLSLILLSFVISVYCDIKEAYTPLISVCLFMGLGVLAGMLNVLFLGTGVLYALTILGGAAFAYKNQVRFRKFMLSLPIVCLILSSLFIGILFLLREPYFVSWDEFSHWGPFLKELKLSKAIHIYSEREFVHQTYVQGMPILYYIGSFFDRTFREEAVYFVYSVFLHTCAITIVPSISVQKNYKISLVNILLIPFLWYFFPYASYAAPYTSSYLDVITGAMFGGIMMFILCNSSRRMWSKKKLWCLSVLLFALLQTKDIAITFYLICVATCGINLIYQMQTDANIGKKAKQQLILRQIVYTVIIPLCGKLMWSILLNVKGKTADQFAQISIGKVFGLFQSYMSGENAYFGQVQDAFWNGIKTVNISWSRTAIPTVVFVLLVLSGILAYKYYDSEKNRLVSLHVGLLFVYFWLYVAVLFFTYLCSMSEAEAMSNASMDRYIATFVSGWAMVLFGLALKLLYKHNAKGAASLVLVVSLYIYFTIPLRGIVYWDLPKEQSIFSGYEEQKEVCSNIMREGSNIWLIKSGNDNNHIKFIFSYMLMPLNVSSNLPVDDTIYTINDMISVAEANQIDYFMVIDSNESFKERYKDYITVEHDADNGRFMIMEFTEKGTFNQIY